MKTLFFLLAFCLSALSALSQSPASFRKTNDTTWGWQNNSWLMTSTTSYGYEDKKITASWTETPDGRKWREVTNYDAQGRIIRYQRYFNDVSAPPKCGDYGYDAFYTVVNGKLQSLVRISRDTLDQLMLFRRDSMHLTYNGKGQEILREWWGIYGDTLDFHSKYAYEYDAQGRLYREYNFRIPDAPFSRDTYIYNPNEQLIRIEGEHPDFLDTTKWHYSRGTGYSYDGKGLLIAENPLSWDGTKWTQGDAYAYQYKYDANGNLVENLMKNIPIGSADYENFAKITSGYSEISAVAENENQPNFFSRLSPNPASEETEIAFSLPSDGVLTLEIRDILGNIALPTETKFFSAGENRAKIGIKPLAQGVYFCSLRAGNFTETRRLLIVK